MKPLSRLGATMAGWFPEPAGLRSRRKAVFGATVALTSACLAARVLLIPADYDELMLLPLLVSVMVSAHIGGLWPGLLSTVLAVLGASYFIVAPQGSLAVDSRLDLLQLILFFVSGAVGSVLTEALGRAVIRDRRHIERLERARARLGGVIRGYGDLRTALDEHAIVAVTDERGRIIRVNDKFCAISGYSREELIGRDHRLINSGRHPKEFFREMWATILAGRPWHGEVENRAKNGAYYWVNTTIVPILSRAGRPSHFIAIRADITARKQAEEALRRQGAELQVLFDLIPAMIWFKDTKNNHLRVNKRAAEAVGLPVSAIEGRPASAVYPKEADRFYADDLQVILTRRPKLGIIETIPDKHGRKCWIETNKVPYFDDYGNVIGIVVTAQDITERHAAEEALRLSEERFRQLAENINEVFWIEDPQNHRVLYVSPAFERVWGKTCQSLYTDPAEWSASIIDEDRERVRAALVRIEEQPYDETYRILRPDGQTRWIHDRGYPVRDASGKVY
ncbi:MAG: PAS domain S-box protein [Verrucomicrobiota bacterium]